MIIDTLLAECMQAIQAFRALVSLKTDLACQKLVADFLGEFPAGRRRRHAVEGVEVNGCCVVPLSILSAPKPRFPNLVDNLRIIH